MLLLVVLYASGSAEALPITDRPGAAIATSLVKLAYDDALADLASIAEALRLPALVEQAQWRNESKGGAVAEANYAGLETTLGIVILRASRSALGDAGTRTGLSLAVDADRCPSSEEIVRAAGSGATQLSSNAYGVTMRLPTKNQDSATISLANWPGAAVNGRAVCAILIDHLPGEFHPAAGHEVR